MSKTNTKKLEYIGIMAHCNNHVIGKNGEIPFHSPQDKKFFKKVTAKSILIMGKNTYVDIIENYPKADFGNRVVIVVSTTLKKTGHKDSIYIVESIEEARLLAIKTRISNTDLTNKVFICGGRQIYESFRHICRNWYITSIDADIEGDVIYKPLPLKDDVMWKGISLERIKRDYSKGEVYSGRIIHYRLYIGMEQQFDKMARRVEGFK